MVDPKWLAEQILASKKSAMYTRLIELNQYDLRHQRIQRLAYELWKRAGCPNGEGIRFWERAEKEDNVFIIRELEKALKGKGEEHG